MKKKSQIGKEWAKVIAAGLVTALILNSTVSLYAEENTDASPAPSTTQEINIESTPEAAVEPTTAVPETTPVNSEVPEQPKEIEEQPSETPEQSEEIEKQPSETPEPAEDVEEQPESSETPLVGTEDEVDKGEEVPTSTPAELPEESATVAPTPESSPEVNGDEAPTITPDSTPSVTPTLTPEVCSTATPKASPTVTPEEVANTLSVTQNLPGNLGSVEVVLLNGQTFTDCELKVESSGVDKAVFTEGIASVKGIEIFEIHLENEAGEEVLLPGSCDVTISFEHPLFEGMTNVDYMVLHKNGENVEMLKRISGSEAGLSSVNFTTASFSPFAVMAVENTIKMMSVAPVGNGGTLTTELNSLVSNVEISGAETDAEGNLIIYDGKQYSINLAFKETEALQFNNTEPMVYQLPAEVIPPA